MQRFSLQPSFWIIFALGLTLRLFHLGSDGFWVDELGVARAAFAATLREAVDVANSHVMAMPMDYIVAWLMGRVAVTEGWLRLPSALWSALTLPAAFLLYRQLLNRSVAMWGVFLLALSPVLIMYSQELRFYAPLIFFYTTANALGLRAVQYSKSRYWLAFVTVTIIGLFFHLYVTFAFVNVIVFSVANRGRNTISMRALFFSFVTIFVAAIIAVMQFGSLAGEHSSLFAYESPSQVLLVGLGFLPPFPAAWTANIFGAILFALTLLGLTHAGKLISLGISIAVQIGVIIALDIWYGYFASMRQLLLFLPLVGIFTARGLELFLNWLDRVNHRNRKHLLYGKTHAGVMILLLISASFVIIPYYRIEKTSTPDILKTLGSVWAPGEIILVSPAYELSVYIYYAPWFEGDLHPFDPALLEDASFVISGPDVNFGNGFELLYEPSTGTLYPHILWISQ